VPPGGAYICQPAFKRKSKLKKKELYLPATNTKIKITLKIYSPLLNTLR
jgi:hypothetical protein